MNGGVRKGLDVPSVTVIGCVQADVVMSPVTDLPSPGGTLLTEQMTVRLGGAGANAGSGAADDVFDLTLSGPAALADTPPDAPPVPLAWTPLTGAELFSRAFDLVHAALPATEADAPAMLADLVQPQAFAASINPVQPDAASYLIPA